jgi:hypothetical protein
MSNPQYYAISSLEVDIIITPEILHSQSHINLTNNATITIDNIGSIERDLLVKLTLNNASGNIVLTNQTTSQSITITKA